MPVDKSYSEFRTECDDLTFRKITIECVVNILEETLTKDRYIKEWYIDRRTESICLKYSTGQIRFVSRAELVKFLKLENAILYRWLEDYSIDELVIYILPDDKNKPSYYLEQQIEW